VRDKNAIDEIEMTERKIQKEGWRQTERNKKQKRERERERKKAKRERGRERERAVEWMGLALYQMRKYSRNVSLLSSQKCQPRFFAY
jgi:hypothetical protein